MPPTARVRDSLSLAQARRIAVAAQGLSGPRPATVGMRQITSVVERIGLLQIDSVNVLARAHLLPLFSRLGPYDTALLDRAMSRSPRRLVEYWAHEASLVPPETYRLLCWRQRRARDEAWGGMRRVADERPDLVAAVTEEVRRRGPLTAAALEAALERDLPRSQDYQWGWNWSDAKRALEYLFWAGEVSSAGRTAQFERRYDLTARVLPLAMRDRPAPTDDDAFDELVRIGARAQGIGTEISLRDYFRLRPEDFRPAMTRLVEAGELVGVAVEGWRKPGWLWHQARVPRRVSGRALLAPFDPLIWERARTEQLFGFRYRVEIYVPEPQRVHGYYVLPFLLDDRLVARVDLKADRTGGRLLVQAAWAEVGAPDHTAEALLAELRSLATWLGLGEVTVAGRGDHLAERLAALAVVAA